MTQSGKDPHPTLPNVKAKKWIIDGIEQEVILIYSGDYFISVEYKHARSMVDSVHDAVDRYEASLRKGTQ
jgi:hypothetical protein